MEKRETTKKFIIENHSRLDDFSMMGRIMEVINNGLVSNDGKEYCYVTRFKGKCVVEMRKTNYGYRVIVQDDIPESSEGEKDKIGDSHENSEKLAKLLKERGY